jgi:putative phosphoesterase
MSAKPHTAPVIPADQDPGGVRRIGVISDTHGLVPPGVAAVFNGLDLILHAGDLDTPEVLRQLERLAPVVAVRGNMDRGAWAKRLPMAETVDCDGVAIHVRHILSDLDLDPSAAGFGVVVSGHTHRPEQRRSGGVLFLNPGSASMPRGGTQPSVAVLTVSGQRIEARFVDLESSGYI